MPRKGLNKENVIRAALELIEEEGYAAFSLNALARKLGVRAASLYNHVESLDDVLAGAASAANAMMIEAEEKAMAGKSRDEAVFALAAAYRAFAKERYELYKVIFSLQGASSDVLRREVGRMIAPIMEALANYRLDELERRHWQRVLRSVMHGFVAHEEAGGFAHFSAARDDSYRLAINCVIEGVKRMEEQEEAGGERDVGAGREAGAAEVEK